MSKFQIPLNGSNHISVERHKAFEEALNDDHVVKFTTEDNNEAQIEAPASRKETVRGSDPGQSPLSIDKTIKNEVNISPDLIKGIEMSLNQSFAHQNRTMDIHQKYLDQQQEYAQIIKEVLNQQGKVLENGNSTSGQNIIDTLQRSLENFHQMREKGMEVHQQFLSQQADFSQSFVRVLEKQHGLTPNGKVQIVEPKREILEDPVSSEIPKKELVIEVVEASEPDVVEDPPSPDEISTTQTALSSDQELSPEILAAALLQIVGEKTGYPVEMLELDMDLEADLGIDSIKRVEILGALEEEFPSLPSADTEVLGQTRTLKEIVDYLKSETGQPANPVPMETKQEPTQKNSELHVEKPAAEPKQEQAEVPAASAGISIEGLTSTLLEIVAEKTGYPAEMLELSMDLEADLGIDSIKRVEILGAMEDRVPGLPPVETEVLAELRTLEEIVSMMSTAQTSPNSLVEEGSESKKKVDQSSLVTTPVMLTELPKADFLEFDISPEQPVIVTDEGSDLSVLLSDALIKEGWKVILLSFADTMIKRKSELSSEVIKVDVKDPSPDGLHKQLKSLRDRFGSFSGFIHLHPDPQGKDEYSKLDRDLVKRVFFLAGALKDDLTVKQDNGRSLFMTVTRINGQLGLGPADLFQEGSGLTGVVKTLSWEWPEVFTRAIDLDPEMGIQEQVDCVIQEIHDPDRELVEVGIGQENRYTIEREGFEKS